MGEQTGYFIRTQQNRWLPWDTVVTITLGQQIGKLYQDTVGCIVTLDTIDRTINEDTVDGTTHSRQDVTLGHSK